MKVRRLKAEKASRAKELWRKAESAAAFQKKLDKERLAAAIKIQVRPRTKRNLSCAPLGHVIDFRFTVDGSSLEADLFCRSRLIYSSTVAH